MKKSIKTLLCVEKYLKLGGELKENDIIFTKPNMECLSDSPYTIYSEIFTVIKFVDGKGILTKEKSSYLGTGWTFIEAEICLKCEINKKDKKFDDENLIYFPQYNIENTRIIEKKYDDKSEYYPQYNDVEYILQTNEKKEVSGCDKKDNWKNYHYIYDIFFSSLEEAKNFILSLQIKENFKEIIHKI